MIAGLLFITAGLFTSAAMLNTSMSSKVTNKNKTQKCSKEHQQFKSCLITYRLDDDNDDGDDDDGGGDNNLTYVITLFYEKVTTVTSQLQVFMGTLELRI